MKNWLRFILLLPFISALCGCFEMTVHSTMDRSGNVNNNYHIVTNVLLAGAFDDKVKELRREGKNVEVSTDDNGNLHIRWDETGFPFKRECSGVLLWKKCHAWIEQRIENTAQQGDIYSDILISELTPKLHYYFDMPKSSYLNSNADRVQEVSSGLYRVYWGRKLTPGSTIRLALDYKP